MQHYTAKFGRGRPFSPVVSTFVAEPQISPSAALSGFTDVVATAVVSELMHTTTEVVIPRNFW